MARSIATIKQQIIEAKNAEPGLAGLTSNSQTAIWNLWAYITAVAINLHEQLWDIFRAEIDDLALKVVPGTPEWLRKKVLEFQYSDDEENRQVLKLNNNLVPTYDTIDENLQIVTRCSIKQELGRTVVIKVAKGTEEEGIVPLGYPYESDENEDDNDELDALKSYVDKIKFAGTSIMVITRHADRIRINVKVYYDGQYVGSVVKENTIEAIKNYLASIPFDGVVLNTKIVDAIQLVEGVKDVELISVGAHAHNDPVITPVQRSYLTVAGYIIPEDENTPYSLDNTIEVIRA